MPRAPRDERGLVAPRRQRVSDHDITERTGVEAPWPRQDSNSQSPAPQADALSIGPLRHLRTLQISRINFFMGLAPHSAPFPCFWACRRAFFCVQPLALPRALCPEALGQSAPSAPTKPGPAFLRRHPLRNAWDGCMLLRQALPVCKLLWRNTAETPAGLEPAIPGSVGRCLIHWATGPVGTHPCQPITRTTHG